MSEKLCKIYSLHGGGVVEQFKTVYVLISMGTSNDNHNMRVLKYSLTDNTVEEKASTASSSYYEDENIKLYYTISSPNYYWHFIPHKKMAIFEDTTYKTVEAESEIKWFYSTFKRILVMI